MMYWESWFTAKLDKRKAEGLIRELPGDRSSMIDFASNDYLGLSKNSSISSEVKLQAGATGSRLLTGDSAAYHEVEEFLSSYYASESALLFNSGYQANLSILSALPQRHDTIIYDQFSHASIKDGLRLSQAKHVSFLHNNLDDLEAKLKRANGNKYVVVEGIYSMDGDQAPLIEILNISEKYNAGVIIDEAHSGGILGEKGKGLSFEYKDHPALLVRLYTFGKAYGAHGACFSGSNIIKDYLINFARPFIYTTALPPHAIFQIMQNLKYLETHSDLQEKLNQNIQHFRKLIKDEQLSFKLLDSSTPIQAIIIPGNTKVREIAGKLQFNGYDVRPILSPTVPAGSERLRVCLHEFNRESEIKDLIKLLAAFK